MFKIACWTKVSMSTRIYSKEGKVSNVSEGNKYQNVPGEKDNK